MCTICTHMRLVTLADFHNSTLVDIVSLFPFGSVSTKQSENALFDVAPKEVLEHIPQWGQVRTAPKPFRPLGQKIPAFPPHPPPRYKNLITNQITFLLWRPEQSYFAQWQERLCYPLIFAVSRKHSTGRSQLWIGCVFSPFHDTTSRFHIHHHPTVHPRCLLLTTLSIPAALGPKPCRNARIYSQILCLLFDPFPHTAHASNYPYSSLIHPSGTTAGCEVAALSGYIFYQ